MGDDEYGGEDSPEQDPDELTPQRLEQIVIEDPKPLGWGCLGLLVIGLIFLVIGLAPWFRDATSSNPCKGTGGASHTSGLPAAGPVLGRSARLVVPASRRSSARLAEDGLIGDSVCVNTLTGDGSGNAPHYEKLTPAGGPDASSSDSSTSASAAASALAPGDGGGGQGNPLNPEAARQQSQTTPHVDSTPQGPDVVLVPQPQVPCDPSDPSAPCYVPPPDPSMCHPDDPTCGGGGSGGGGGGSGLPPICDPSSPEYDPNAYCDPYP